MKTGKQRLRYHQFRTLLLKENFTQMQNSLYLRHHPTMASAESTIQRLEKHVPEGAKLAFFLLTDKQYSMTKTYFGLSKSEDSPSKPEQIVLF